jgi:hypothetical protein
MTPLDRDVIGAFPAKIIGIFSASFGLPSPYLWKKRKAVQVYSQF